MKKHLLHSPMVMVFMDNWDSYNFFVQDHFDKSNIIVHIKCFNRKTCLLQIYSSNYCLKCINFLSISLK